MILETHINKQNHAMETETYFLTQIYSLCWNPNIVSYYDKKYNVR